MSKKLQSKNIIITKAVYEKALRYAMSLNEVGFLFFGNGNLFTEVVRIKNIHENKRNRFVWDENNRRGVALRYLKKFKTSLEGHSHSNKGHLRYPSLADVQYFNQGPHIIVFPYEKNIRCWCLKKNVKKQRELVLLIK